MDKPIKLGNFAEFTNDKAAELIFAVKRQMDEFGVKDITIHTHYDIDFWREIVEVDVLLNSGHRVRHIERIEVKDLQVDVDDTLDKMISKFEAWFWAKARNLKMQIDDEHAEFIHTHYADDGKWVCEDPSRLDDIGEFLVIGRSVDLKPLCKICQQLVLAHNVKTELRSGKPPTILHESIDSPIRGLLYGAAVSSVIWIVLIIAFFLVAAR